MVWVDVFRGFLSICGFSIAVFLMVQGWKAMREKRLQAESLTPEQRRENWRAALGTIGGLLVGAAVIYAAYQWGESEWGSRAGAAMAIGAFMIVIICLFAALAMLGVRDARRDRAQRAGRH
jgi:uncharacterized membrane protein YcjF (UPF0283 family)